MPDTRVTLHFTLSDGSTQDADFVLHERSITSTDGSVTVNTDATSGDIDLSANISGLLQRGVSSGNWSMAYPDSPSAASACGPMGSGVYWKTTLNFSRATPGDAAVPVNVYLQHVPCMEDGTLVSYTCFTEYVRATAGVAPTAILWFVCETVPTHLLDLATKTPMAIVIAESVDTSGLSGIYPTAEVSFEPQYTVSYFYTP